MSRLSTSERSARRSVRVRRLIACLALLISFGTSAFAQAPDSLISAVRQLVDAGDATGLVELGEPRIEVGLFGAARLYSKSQARRVLLGFFRQHPPTRLVISESVSTDRAWFGAGEYHRLAGREPFQLYIRLRRQGGAWLLREFVVLESEGL
ncbi:MAG: DUF4783 domain-containing protein [Rhodothermales bacterium]|nr:DUF4783 domain-containing protein [Rhodothermales bacterium]